MPTAIEEHVPLWAGIKEEIGKCGYVYSDMFALLAACYVTKSWDGDPLWMLIIGPPSTGKSCAMSLFKEANKTITISSLTPAALVTAWGGEDSDHSMFGRINDTLVCVKDFGTVLSLGWENMNSVLALLREAFDGYVSKDFAVIRREYLTHFNLCAAATESVDLHLHLWQHLGERFLRFRPRPTELPYPIPPISEKAPKLVSEWLSKIISCKCPTPESNWIQDLACLAVRLRTTVTRDKYSKEVLDLPALEQPHRLCKQLTKLFQGLIVVTGSEIESARLTKLAMVATVPPARRVIAAFVQGRPEMGCQDIKEAVGLGQNTTRNILEDFELLGVMCKDEMSVPVFPNRYKWRLTGDVEFMCDMLDINLGENL